MDIAKTKIDRLRDGAITLKMGSNVKEFLSTSANRYAVTEQAIYKISLADEIDPERTNPDIPNCSQEVISAGYNDEVVGRILMTAKYLFDENKAEVSPVIGSFFEAVIELTNHVLELKKMISELKEEIVSKEKYIINTQQEPDTFMLPSITDLKIKVHNILVMADKAKDGILLLYKIHLLPDADERPKLHEYCEAIQKVPNIDNDALTSWEEKRKFLSLVRNTRNCSEHPKQGQRILLDDFTMRPDGSITAPIIQIEHEETPIGLHQLIKFMEFLERMIIDYAELSSAFIKSLSLMKNNPFNEWVSEFPEEQRRHPHVRYYRSVNMGGTSHILG